MLHFFCPSCKTPLQAPEDFAGKTIVCSGCQATATVPASASAISAVEPMSLPPLTGVTTPELAEAAEKAKGRWHDDPLQEQRSILRDGGMAWTLTQRAVCGLTGLAIVAVLIALLVPARRRVGDASARVQSINNIKQIVLAAHNFQDAHKKLPFNGTREAVANDFGSGSWAFQILPYIDSGPVFNDPKGAMNTSIAYYMCPGRARNINVSAGPTTDYHLNIYLNTKTVGNGWNAPDANVSLKDIVDGTSNTIFVGHGWLQPSSYSSSEIPGRANSIFLGGIPDLARGGKDVTVHGTGPDVVLQRDSDTPLANGALVPWGGPFSQGAIMGMADGTVRVFPYTMSGTMFGAFLTPSNGEVVVLPDS